MALLPFPVGNAIMILVGAVLIYLALKKGYEPLLLIPIGFGAILVNLPYGGLMDEGGILKIIYDAGILTEIFPILIFVGIGAMTDFGPLLERPSLLLFSIPAQLGISAAFLAAYLIGFTPYEAMSVGIIGAMDGPTAIYVTSHFAPSLLGPVTICAYSYMSMIPILQVPLSKFLDLQEGEIGTYEVHAEQVSPINSCYLSDFRHDCSRRCRAKRNPPYWFIDAGELSEGEWCSGSTGEVC